MFVQKQKMEQWFICLGVFKKKKKKSELQPLDSGFFFFIIFHNEFVS